MSDEKVFPDDYGWDDLMTLMDKHWPTTIFPVIEDSDAMDSGSRILSLARLLVEEREKTARQRKITEVFKEANASLATYRASEAEYWKAAFVTLAEEA